MRGILFFVAAALLTSGLARPIQAQEERECECRLPFGQLRIQRVDDWGNLALLGSPARLGVYVNGRANPETDSIGALVDVVTPGSPAAKAGIREGDIITRLNGESLLTGGGAYDEDESAPGMRLIERARKLERGDTVTVELRRDGERKTAEVVAGDFGDVTLEWSDLHGELGDATRLRGLMERYQELPRVLYRGPETFALAMGTRFPGLELVSLNPDLGRYFGTDEGVLVVSVPEASELNLKSGDVILAVDGRTIRNPSHAMRILRSYEADEQVSLRIMRDKKERTVTGRVPESLGGAGVFRVEPKQR